MRKGEKSMPRLRSGREGLDQQIHLDVGEGTSSKQKKTRPPIENVAGLSEQQKLSSIMGEMAFPGREETNPSKSSIDRLVAKAKMLELALEKAKSDDNTNTQLIEDLNTICEFKDNKLIEAAVSRIVDRTGEHKDPSINRAIRFIKMRHMVRDVD